MMDSNFILHLGSVNEVMGGKFCEAAIFSAYGRLIKVISYTPFIIL